MNIDIGLDPDSKAHGCAIAVNKALTTLACMNLMQLQDFFNANRDNTIKLHVEDVLASNSVFKKKGTKGARPEKEVARSLGLCQQSLTELLRMIEHNKYDNITIHRYKISSRWKDSKEGGAMMKQVWGWSKRSNEETRSAAYFLALGCR